MVFHKKKKFNSWMAKISPPKRDRNLCFHWIIISAYNLICTCFKSLHYENDCILLLLAAISNCLDLDPLLYRLFGHRQFVRDDLRQRWWGKHDCISISLSVTTFVLFLTTFQCRECRINGTWKDLRFSDWGDPTGNSSPQQVLTPFFPIRFKK